MTLPSFTIGDITFVLDNRPGPERGKSAGNEFVLVKTPEFIDFYRSLRSTSPQDVLEIGMFEGGSMVLFDQLYSPRRLVGIDIRPEIVALEEYRAERPNVRALYGVSQDDPTLVGILQEQFPDGIDLVVDDASHLYELSRSTFHMVFPKVRPGGAYVIEDWGWSHQLPYQSETHPLYSKPALTNLVLEIVMSTAFNTQVDSVLVQRGWVMITKSQTAQGQIDLDALEVRLRGRPRQLL